MQKNSEEDRAYLKTVNGFTILLLVREARLGIRAYKNDNMSICYTANYGHEELPPPFPSVFANVVELYNEFKSLKENMLQVTEAGHLQYTLPLATKAVQLLLPLQKHINTREQALQFDNFALKKKVKELEASKLKVQNLLKAQQTKRKQLEQRIQLMNLRLKVSDKKRNQVQQPLSAQKTTNIVAAQKQPSQQTNTKNQPICSAAKEKNDESINLIKEYEMACLGERLQNSSHESKKRPLTKLKWGNAGRKMINPSQRGHTLQIKARQLFNFFIDEPILKQNRFHEQQNQICLVRGEKNQPFDAISSQSLPMESCSVVGLRLIYEGAEPIFFGVMTLSAKNQQTLGQQGRLALNLKGGAGCNGCLRMEGVSIQPQPVDSFVRGQSLHFKICTTNGIMEWYRNKSLIFSHYINQSLLEEPLYPFVRMSSTGSKVEML